MDKHIARMTGSDSSRFLQTRPRGETELQEVRQRELSYLSTRGHVGPRPNTTWVSPRSQGVSSLPTLRGDQAESGRERVLASLRSSRTYQGNWSQTRSPGSVRAATAHGTRAATVSSPRTSRSFLSTVESDGQGAATATSTHDMSELAQARSSMGSSMYAATFRGMPNERYDRSMRPYAANGARSEIMATSSHSLCSGSGKFGYF
jgi:hypothetical protein